MTADASAKAAPPRWPRSRQTVWLAALVAALLVLAALSFVIHKSGEMQRSHLAAAELHARALEELSASALAGTESILRALTPAVEDPERAADPSPLNGVFAVSLRGRPFLRSLSLLDAQGRVLASSNPQNVGLTVPPALVAARSPDGVARLSPLLSGRDLDDLGQLPLASARVTVLPMVLPLAGARGPVRLVALVNPDHFATQFERLLDRTTLRALLVGMDGQLVVASSAVNLAPGTSLRTLRAFSKHLPAREAGSERGPGAEGPAVLGAYRALRQWPLVVLVEQPYTEYVAELVEVLVWVGAFLAVSLAMLTLGARLARAALLHDEQASAELQAAHAAMQAGEAALRASEAGARATFEQAAVGVIQQSPDGRLLRVNQTLCELLGYTRNELMALGPADLLHADDLASCMTGVGRLFAGDLASFADDKRFVRKDGSLVWARVTASAARDEAGRALYIICIVQDISARRRAEDDLAAARRRELLVGARIQQSLLVTPPPDDADGLQISSFNAASQGIDGDFVEFVRAGPHCVDVIAGDVMGKGTAAALMGAATKLQFSRSFAELMSAGGGAAPQPAAVVAAVHRAMTPSLQALEAFVTLCYLRVDTRNDRITWVGCGHEETLHVGRGGAVQPLPNQHPPLGVLDHSDYRQDEQALLPGEALFLCSDGVTEAVRPDGERIGREEVAQAVASRLLRHRSPAAMLHGLRADLLQHEVTVQDDVTMVVVRREPAAPAPARIELPVQLQALHRLREFVTRHTLAAGLDEGACGLLEVATVEAFTNIVRHGRGLLPGAPVELLVEVRGDTLTIQLVHLGEAFVPPTPQAPDLDGYPEGGFGLAIIQAASDETAYAHDAGVNTLTITKHLGRTAAS